MLESEGNVETSEALCPQASANVVTFDGKTLNIEAMLNLQEIVKCTSQQMNKIIFD